MWYRETAHALVEEEGEAKDMFYCQHLDSSYNSPNDQGNVDVASATERAMQASVRMMLVELGHWVSRHCTYYTAINSEGGSRKLTCFRGHECAEGKKVKFAAATLEGPTLTWWKTKVATMGLETVNQMPWTEMKQLMTAEFCSIKEIQRMEHELST
ncbi:hypothetical protein Tco_0040628 [Tanacetum coccineum]